MKIVKAGKKDAGVIIRLVTDLISELGGTPFVIDETDAAELINRSIDRGKYIAFLALDGSGNAAGVITASESAAVYAGGAFGVIHEFYIVPEKRSGGLGRQMVEKIKQTAVDMCWKRLEVGAPACPEWERTKDFYLREGFLEVGPRLKWMVEP